MLDISDVVFADVETSTDNPVADDLAVIQASAVLCDNTHFDSLINPGDEILNSMSPSVIAVTSLTPDHIREVGVKDARGVMTQYVNFIQSKKVVCGHNWKFDLSAIATYCASLGVDHDLFNMKVIDTMRICRELYDPGEWTGNWLSDKIPSFNLGTCFYFVVPENKWSSLKEKVASGKPHDALYDSHMCMMMIEHIVSSGVSVDELVEISSTPFKPRLCPIGKDHKGKPWEAVPDGFLKWIVNNNIYNDDPGFEEAVLEEIDRRNLRVAI